MLTFRELYQLFKDNEVKSRKFSRIETKILNILNFKDLFETLLTEISQEFAVPFIWITLIDGTDTSRLLLKAAHSSGFLPDRLRMVSRSQFHGLIGTGTTPTLINEEISSYRCLVPEGAPWMIRSMSIAPITLDGEIIGSLSQGDQNPERFTPDMDPILLEELALKFSLCLSNVTAHEKLRLLAFHDPLTELLNRRAMEHALEQEFNRSRRYKRELTVVFADLDKFKAVNDQFGHDAGDQMLMHVADLIRSLTRESDILCRFAGDEFVLVLPETTQEMASSMMLRIQKQLLSTPIYVDATSISQEISFGMASLSTFQGKSWAELLKEADKALYIHKNRRATHPGTYHNEPPDIVG